VEFAQQAVVPSQKVELQVKLNNMDFTSLVDNPAIKHSVITSIQSEVATATQVPTTPSPSC
jgi:hypothetical protein